MVAGHRQRLRDGRLLDRYRHRDGIEARPGRTGEVILGWRMGRLVSSAFARLRLIDKATMAQAQLGAMRRSGTMVAGTPARSTVDQSQRLRRR